MAQEIWELCACIQGKLWTMEYLEDTITRNEIKAPTMDIPSRLRYKTGSAVVGQMFSVIGLSTTSCTRISAKIIERP